LDSGKVNIAPPAQTAKWFRIIGVPLDNGQGIYPAGDNVQTVEPWQPPSTWDGLNSVLLNRILDEIEAGCPPDGTSRYSISRSAKERAAWRAVTRHAPDKNEQQAREIIRIWHQNGVIYAEDYDDPTARKKFQGLRVNHTKRPS
jgi:hypothetical protein